MAGDFSWSVWEGYARGDRLRGHRVLLEVAERSLRKSGWARRGFRKAEREDQDRMVFDLTAVLVKILAEDYEYAQRIGLDLPKLSQQRTRRFPGPKRAAADRARLTAEVGNLADAEYKLSWYEDEYVEVDVDPLEREETRLAAEQDRAKEESDWATVMPLAERRGEIDRELATLKRGLADHKRTLGQVASLREKLGLDQRVKR